MKEIHSNITELIKKDEIKYLVKNPLMLRIISQMAAKILDLKVINRYSIY